MAASLIVDKIGTLHTITKGVSIDEKLLSYGLENTRNKPSHVALTPKEREIYNKNLSSLSVTASSLITSPKINNSSEKFLAPIIESAKPINLIMTPEEREDYIKRVKAKYNLSHGKGKRKRKK